MFRASHEPRVLTTFACRRRASDLEPLPTEAGAKDSRFYQMSLSSGSLLRDVAQLSPELRIPGLSSHGVQPRKDHNKN